MNSTEDARKTWIDDFIVELRLRGVKGAAIGDAVSAVESHCDESGERPDEAFGDPREYAGELEFTRAQLDTSGARGWVAALAPVACGLVGLTLTTSTAGAARLGTSVSVSWGAIASLAALTVAVFLIDRRLRTLLDHPVVAVLAMTGVVGVMTVLPIVLRQTAFGLPVALGVILAAALLAYSVVGQYRADRVLDDPVTDPVHGSEMYAGDRPRTFSAAMRIQPWLILIASIALGALTWFTAR